MSARAATGFDASMQRVQRQSWRTKGSEKRTDAERQRTVRPGSAAYSSASVAMRKSLAKPCGWMARTTGSEAGMATSASGTWSRSWM